ncbi:hypothetical protein CAL26_25520 [Bordetella genomosp. 9]|uniref:Uncharacterized protein n=1 Tax=Bordetella genomosp. 9 TaxID=1416803 RepID=A0A261R881_9BORD|nr:hypothetical protein [Bordetella genomosp. 9]OZI20830.1 hypothetical protein CAL26_25520 [Bordetella genomosp. 9]
MAVDGLGVAGGLAYPMDGTTDNLTAASAGDGARAAFRARPGRRQRLKTLIGDMRQMHGLRGKLSLVYARAGSADRVRAMVKWSRTHAGGAVCQDDMQRLYDRVTRRCAGQAHAQVFHRIAENYLAGADTGQLAALRQSLGSATPGPVPWVMRAPKADPARESWAAFSTMLDGELARRALLPALKQVIQALPVPPRADGHALDLACARLATALCRAGGADADASLLAVALGQLSHVELKTLATQLAPPPGAAGVDALARCPLGRALRHLHASPDTSPDLWQQRLGLMGKLRAAANRTVCDRLDYFVHTTSRLIDVQLAQGRPPQAVYDLAAGSLTKSLAVMGYADVLAPGGAPVLAPRLIAAALLGKPLKDVLAYTHGLDVRTLTQLVRAMQSAAPDYAGAAALLCSVRDHHAQGYLDRLAASLRDLETQAGGARRWPIAQGLKTLAQAVQAWESHCLPAGLTLPTDVQQDLRAAVQWALDGLCPRPGGSPGLPADSRASAGRAPAVRVLAVRVLDKAAIKTLCNREVECLRIAQPLLRPYGLSLDKDALAAIALERAAPHVETAADHLADVAQALARGASDPEHAMRALREGAESAASACAECASFTDMAADDVMRVCTRIASLAWRRFIAHHAGSRRNAEAALLRSGYILHDGLNDAASALVQDLDADPPSDGDWRDRLESHAVSRLRLASQLMEALQAVCIPDDDADDHSGSRSAGSEAFIDGWTPDLRRAVADHFGVKYDPARGRCALLMSRAQHERFAAELLNGDLAPRTLTQYEIAGPAGPTVVEIDEQLRVDGIMRVSAQFSVTGVDRLGNYIPYTTSSAHAGEDSHVPGVERGLLALRRLAGPDTAALTTYLTQTAAAGFICGLHALGESGPVRMDDGVAVLPGGMAYMRTDIKRMADGSYTVRINPYWYRLDTATAFDGSAIRLDPVRSFASMASDVRLTPAAQGAWRQEVIGPLMIRHHLVRRDA